MQPYTPPGGNTPQAQATSSLQQTLNQVQGFAPNSPAGQAQGTAMTFANQEPQQVAQAQQSLSQQAGIPNLQNSQQNLGQIFSMYLADQNLSQKYAGSTLQSQNSPLYNNSNLTPQNMQGLFSGYTGGPQNPYLASPTAIVNALSQPSGQGFQGFTTPSGITSSIGEVPSAATNMINMLQGIIGNEQGLVSNKVGDYTKAYESQANLLNTIASLLGQQEQYKQTLAQQKSTSGIGGTAPGSAAEAGSLFNQIVDQVQSAKGGAATEKDVWDYINQHDSALRDQGVNVNELWRLQKQMKDKVGQGGAISGGTKTPKTTGKGGTTEDNAIAALRGFGDFMGSYYKGTMDLGGLNILNPLGQQYTGQRDIYINQLKKTLGASKAQQVTQDIQKNLPGEFSTSYSAEQQFKAHLKQVMAASEVRMVADKSGNVSIIGQKDFNPKSEQQVNIDNLSVKQLQQILGAL